MPVIDNDCFSKKTKFSTGVNHQRLPSVTQALPARLEKYNARTPSPLKFSPSYFSVESNHSYDSDRLTVNHQDNPKLS